jgi:hypothetical protein
MAMLLFGAGSGDGGGGQADPMDLELVRLAQASGAQIAYLETPEEQIGVLRELFTLDDLVDLAANPGVARLLAGSKLDDTVELYRRGDVQGLEREFAASSDPVEAKFMAKMLTNRTRRWVPKIEQMMREQDGVVVAVGAGHVVGQAGLVNLLRQDGYVVERVVTR